MDSDIEKLAEKAKDLRIKKKSPKNWNDLPWEMKEEVVKRVDFKSSLRLRQTARDERHLVDSRKFEFACISVEQEEDGSGCAKVWENEKSPDDPCITLRKDRCFESLASFVAHILKVGNLDSFVIDCNHNFVKEIVKTTESVRIKQLHLFHPELFDSAQLFVRSGKVENLVVFFQNHLSYLMLEADQYIDLCKTNGIKLIEFYDGEHLGRKSFTVVFLMMASGTALLGRTIVLRVEPNEAILELPGHGLIPITDGFSLSTIDDESKNVVFHVSEPLHNDLGTWNKVTMRIV